MPSYKRRRAINVDTGYIESLKQVSEYQFKGSESATAVASMIFEGKHRALYRVKKTGKSKGVSMTEAMWLSIRRRSEIIGKPVSATTQLLLEGAEAHLTPREISFGLERAREREERRAAGNPEEASPPKLPESPPEPPPPAAVAEPVEPEKTDPGGVERVEKGITEAITEEILDSIEAQLGDIPKNGTSITPEVEKENDAAIEIVRQTRDEEAEERNRRNMKLSKGHPIEPEKSDDRTEKHVKAGLDFYGGVFSI